MSQMVTRKGPSNDEKEKRQTDSPVKDMKKKLVVNIEREKTMEKTAERPAADKDKTVDKKAEKTVTTDKKTEKIPDKTTEKKGDKSTEKPEKNGTVAEKEKKDSKDSKTEKKDAGEKSGVPEKKDDKVEKNLKPEKERPKASANANVPSNPSANGTAKQQNGSKQNGLNGSPGSVSGDSSSDDVILVVDEPEDEFPELTYEESDEFEPPTPESGRSFTRRSQVKAMRTPETPRPPSDKDKQEKEAAADESKDAKVLKLKEDVNSDRKLRSSDAPKEDPKKADEKKKEDGQKENGEKTDKVEIQITVEVENEDVGEDKQRRKEDTNYSKSRVKVSPYRRSMRLDQTTSSVQANYTGNNTTMEMDITESSFAEEPSADELSSSYLSAVRGMRGRRSYKQLKELNITRVPKAARTPLPLPPLDPSRPTGTVVGRKRKPDSHDTVELAAEAGEAAGKRIRLLDRLARPFRRAPLDSEIVGINTDLPLTTPILSTETFDPETLKPSSLPSSVPLAPAAAAAVPERDGKRCVVM